MNNMVKTIKKIERIAYKDNKFMLMMQHIDNIDCIKNYMETDNIDIYWNDYSYVIVGIDGNSMEIGDLATTQPLTMIDFKKMISFLRMNILENNITTITCDMRKKTSYRLLNYICKRLGFSVTYNESYYWNNEEMVEIILNCQPPQF